MMGRHAMPEPDPEQAPPDPVYELIEIAPGIRHWSTFHEGIGQPVHSYYVEEAAAVLDPIVPEDVLEGLSDLPKPKLVLLTNRHHYRQSDRLVAKFGCRVLCPRSGLHEFEGGSPVEGYAYGDTVAPGITAHEVGSICPDDAALHIDTGIGFLAFADGLVRARGALSFVPDWLMGDDPDGVKEGLVESFGRLLELDFDGLLFAHGEPLVGGGKEALAEFARP